MCAPPPLPRRMTAAAASASGSFAIWARDVVFAGLGEAPAPEGTPGEPTFDAWAAAAVFAGLRGAGRPAEDGEAPRRGMDGRNCKSGELGADAKEAHSDKASFTVGDQAGTISREKVSLRKGLCKEALVQAAAQARKDAISAKEQQNATRETAQDVVAKNGDQNGASIADDVKLRSCKDGPIQSATQASTAQASDIQREGHDHGRSVASAVVAPDPTVQYQEWATNVVFSGLPTETREAKSEGDDEPGYVEWATGVVFRALPNNGTCEQPTGKADGVVTEPRDDSGTVENPVRPVHDAESAGNEQSGPSPQSQCAPPPQVGRFGGKVDVKCNAPQMDECDASRKPRRSDEVSFEEWAAGVVLAGLIAAPEAECESEPTFERWATGIVLKGLDVRAKKSGPDGNDETAALDTSARSQKSLPEGTLDASARSEKSISDQMLDASARSKKSINDSDLSMDFGLIARPTAPLDNMLDASARSQKSTNASDLSMDFGQIVRPTAPAKRPPRVSFRNQDSFISNKPLLAKSNSTIDVNEASLDFGTLVEEGITNAPAHLSRTNSDKADVLGRAVGDLGFTYEDSKMSLSGADILDERENDRPQDLDAIERISNLVAEHIDADNEPTEEVIDLDKEWEISHLPRTGICREGANETVPHMSDDPAPMRIENEQPVVDLDREWEVSHRPNFHSDKESLQRNEQPEPIYSYRGNFESSHNGSLPEQLDGSDGAVLDGYHTKANPPSQETRHFVNNIDGPMNAHHKQSTSQCIIPRIITVSVIKEKAEDRVGLVFSDARHRIILRKMMPNSPFRDTDLSINDELLVINGHRIKNAAKAADFIIDSCGALTLTAFKGKRPRESELEMMRLSGSDCSDIHFFTNNGMVHIIRAAGRFARSGKIMTGDVVLTINGTPVNQAETATALLWEGTEQEDRRQAKSEYGLTSYPSQKNLSLPGGLVILLVFSKAKLRHRLAKQLSSALPLKWNRHFNKCAMRFASGKVAPILTVHIDGNCELCCSPEEIDPATFEEIESFASAFYSQFQQSLGELRDALQEAISQSEIAGD